MTVLIGKSERGVSAGALRVGGYKHPVPRRCPTRVSRSDHGRSIEPSRQERRHVRRGDVGIFRCHCSVRRCGRRQDADGDLLVAGPALPQNGGEQDGGRRDSSSDNERLPKAHLRHALARSGSRGGRGRRNFGNPIDRSPDPVYVRRLATSLRLRQPDRLQLPEPERRLGPVERERDQLARVTRISCLVADPHRLDRVHRPEHQDRIGILERPLDLRRETRAASNVVLVAPDVVAFALQPLGEPPRLRFVLARIAEEQLCHAPPRERATLRSLKT